MSKPKYKGFYNIVKNDASKEATINIYGVIGGFNWDTYSFENTADKFVADFKQIEATADIIHVRINSPGGNVHDGLPIFNALNNSEKTIYTYVDGIAYSMAALIALAGEKVYGYNNSLFMVHNASTIVFGNAQDLQDEVEVLSKYDSALGTIIGDKLGITDLAVAEKYLNYKDNFYTAKEALTEGFFDELISNKKSSVPDNIKNMSSKELMDHYMKMNLDLPEPPQPVNPPIMNIERPNIQNVLGLDAPLASTEENGSYLNNEQLEAIETVISNHAIQLDSVNTSLLEAQNSATALTEANNTIVTDVNTALNLEGDAKVTTVAGAFEALNAHIATLGTQPGATHANKPVNETVVNEAHAKVDFNTPFYNKTKQLLNK